MTASKEASFEFDLRRTTILGQYIAAWGEPCYRKIATKGLDRIEVYCFTPSDSIVARYATVGVSGHTISGGGSVDWEFLFVAPKDDSAGTMDEISGFVLDVMAHSRKHHLRLKVGAVMDESPIAPPSWKARAILIDEPRGEPEFLETIHHARQCISLLWVVPIHKAEYDSIFRSGLDEFDAADQASEWSLADPTRESFI